MQWTFVGIGSLIHPIAMIVIVPLWFVAAYFGVKARKNRLTPPQGEETPMLQEDVRSSSTKKSFHHKIAAALFCATIFFTLVAMYNTYRRTARLFPGPHLYGAFLFLFLASVNIAFVPWFKHSTVLRTPHATIGFFALLTLISQVYSAIPILRGVWQTITSQ